MALSRYVKPIIFPLVIAAGITQLYSCQNFKSDHPQAQLVGQASATNMTVESVIAFAEDIEHSKDNLKKLSSLVYERGPEKLFVEHYFNDHGDQVYIENVQPESMERNSRRFYLKNDSLVLVTENKIENSAAGKAYTESRTYLRNYTVFKREVKRASNLTALTGTAFQEQDIKQVTADYKKDIEHLQDALARRGDFDLVFDKIASYPDASFIILKSKSPNGYAASIELVSKDAFIDSLQQDPMHFKENKLNFNWKVEGMDAIYVPSGSPVSSSSTSASGLNR